MSSPAEDRPAPPGRRIAAGVDPRLVPAGALLSLAALVPIVFSTDRRGLHDRMAGTRVILTGRRTQETARQ